MRITNGMMVNNFLNDMNNNLENLNVLQEQRTSGKNFRRPSDDPANVIRAMQLHSNIYENKQFNKNITKVNNWLDTTDTALGQLGGCLGKIREKLVSAGNGAYGKDELKAIKDEVNEVVGNISQILNTSFDGRYIFSGTAVTSKPTKVEKNLDGNSIINIIDKTGNSITKNSTGKYVINEGTTNEKDASSGYQNLKEKLTTEITSGVTMEYNANVTDIMNFKNGNLGDLLKDIITNLDSSGNRDKLVNDNLKQIDDCIGNVLTIRADLGAKQNRMEAAKDLNEDGTFNMTEILSKTEDIDITEKTMEFAVLQYVYVSSLQTSAKVLQPTLIDYLR